MNRFARFAMLFWAVALASQITAIITKYAPTTPTTIQALAYSVAITGVCVLVSWLCAAFIK